MQRIENYVTLEFLSRSSNESFARVAVKGKASFTKTGKIVPISPCIKTCPMPFLLLRMNTSPWISQFVVLLHTSTIWISQAGLE